jgi:ABC-type branched-subunit amino acid transport system substrate-binding protein
VDRSPLLLGMSAAFSGPAADLGRGMHVGIEARLQEAAAGGELPRPVRLLALDDGYEPERTAANMRRLLDVERAIAIVGNVGTPTAEVALPLATAARRPLIGLLTGASFLRRDPPDRFVFNYRASYDRELRALVDHLVERRKVRPDRIAVFAQSDGFGDAGMHGLARALDGWGVADPFRVLRTGYVRNSLDVAAAAETLRGASDRFDALIMIATARPAARLIDKLRREGVTGKLFASVSFVDSSALSDELKELGSYVDDVITAQVVPHPASNASGVLAYREALQRFFPEESPSFVSLEGYIVGALVVAALGRCRRFDGDGLVAALEGLRDLDLGIGAPISFSPSDHDASDRVWATVLTKGYEQAPLELG